MKRFIMLCTIGLLLFPFAGCSGDSGHQDPCAKCGDYVEIASQCPCCGVSLCKSCFADTEAYSGYVDGLYIGYDEGYSIGYDEGLWDGQIAGSEDGYAGDFNDDYTTDYSSDYSGNYWNDVENSYSEGYSEGFDDGSRLVIDYMDPDYREQWWDQNIDVIMEYDIQY